MRQHDTRSQRRLTRSGDVRHLLRRLTFAATPETERLVAGRPIDEALDALVSSARRAPAPTPPAAAVRPWTNTALRTLGMTSQQYQTLRIAQAEASAGDIEALRHWWLHEMVVSGAPLRENLILFFQGTIGSSSFGDAPQAIFGVNALMRGAGLGTIPALLEQLVVEPAMILQLGIDEYKRDKDGNLFDRPAKLLLDNWTVGPGEYAASDVTNLCRAMTGWILLPPKGQATTPVDPEAFRSARRLGLEPSFDAALFESGAKTILGKTDDFDSRSAIRFLARHPATARRYSRLLIAYLGVEDPDRRLEATLIETYRTTDGSVEALLRDIVRSEQFWADSSRWALIKSPIHLLVGACRQLGITDLPAADVSRWLVATGQRLFDTPNFGDGNWVGQEAWVTPPDRLAVRYELGSVLMGRVPPLGVAATGRGNDAAARQLPVDPSLRRAAASEVVTRLDPAPGIEATAVARGPAGVDETVRRVLSTRQYQLA